MKKAHEENIKKRVNKFIENNSTMSVEDIEENLLIIYGENKDHSKIVKSAVKKLASDRALELAEKEFERIQKENGLEELIEGINVTIGDTFSDIERKLGDNKKTQEEVIILEEPAEETGAVIKEDSELLAYINKQNSANPIVSMLKLLTGLRGLVAEIRADAEAALEASEIAAN